MSSITDPMTTPSALEPGTKALDFRLPSTPDQLRWRVHAERSRATRRCTHPLLDEPMVLLDDVVQIRRRPATTAATEFTGLLQLGDGAGVGRMLVHVDHSRPRSPNGQNTRTA